MAKREVLGTCRCPECDHDAAEIKAQKSGLAYRWCPECNAQYFTRTDETSARLLAKIGKAAPVTVSDTAPKKNDAPIPKAAPPVPDTEPPKGKPKAGSVFDNLFGAN